MTPFPVIDHLEFDDVIQNLDPAFWKPFPTTHFIAPGFIDLQVNGFAGVDYNSPDAPHEEIARSLRVDVLDRRRRAASRP